MYTPVNSSSTILKWSVRGSTFILHGHVSIIGIFSDDFFYFLSEDMTYMYLSFVFMTILTVTRADYMCFCNYDPLMFVYRQPSNNSTVIGRLQEFDCKPTYGNNTTSNSSDSWMAIQYQKQVRNFQNCMYLGFRLLKALLNRKFHTS